MAKRGKMIFFLKLYCLFFRLIAWKGSSSSRDRAQHGLILAFIYKAFHSALAVFKALQAGYYGSSSPECGSAFFKLSFSSYLQANQSSSIALKHCNPLTFVNWNVLSEQHLAKERNLPLRLIFTFCTNEPEFRGNL